VPSKPYEYPERALDEAPDEIEPHVGPKILYGILTIGVLLIIGTAFYMQFERWSFVDSLFFSTETITTVGYGERRPTTDFTKLFTVAYILVGVGIALYVLSSIAAEIIKKREVEFLDKYQKGNLRHIGHIGKHIKFAAGKFAYDKEHLTDPDQEKR